MTSLKSVIGRLRRTISAIERLDQGVDEIKINQGLLLAASNCNKESCSLRDYEYKIFSQWGDDGIIQRLTTCIEIENKTFIEFGVEDFLESNCRYLMMKDNWSGFVIDGSSTNIRRLKQSYFYCRYDLLALHAFITKDNINELLARSAFAQDLGILSIDLDGNDYHILEAITFFNPRILICEYNAVFGATRKISIPYDPHFVCGTWHYSNLYFGASLGAIAHLAKRKGYSLVGTNSAGANAFFVRDDLLNGQLKVLGAAEAFSPSKFRSSRDQRGALSYVSGDDRLELIKGFPVFNVETNTIEPL